MRYNILLSGVGGQGLMLLSSVIGEACTLRGVKVVVQEQHGLAQRSGSISAHVRIGDAYSPMVPIGEADMIIAMEAMEALRCVEYLRPGGAVVMNTRMMHPVIETIELVNRRRENLPYVTLDQITRQLKKRTEKMWALDANALAAEARNLRTENVVLLGAASRVEGFPLLRDALLQAVKRVVPERTVAANVVAFELGEKAVG
ncbi:MAG: indolepyruvate oxidoreductase subunit beta [Candidatus Bathyarchaeota archaeon]